MYARPISSDQCTERLADRYAAAWASRDIEAIVGLHTTDSTFRLVVDDAAEVRGHEALKSAFADLFAQWSELRFDPIEYLYGEAHWVLRSRTHATAATAMALPGAATATAGVPVVFEAVDLLTARGGLIASKVTYIDAVSIQRQIAAAAS